MKHFLALAKQNVARWLNIAAVFLLFAVGIGAVRAPAVRMEGGVPAISAVGPGHWTILETQLKNSGSARRIRVTASFDGGGASFVRPLTIPPHCSMRTTILAHCPRLPLGQSHAVIHAQVLLPGVPAGAPGTQWAAIMPRRGATAIFAGRHDRNIGNALQSIQTAYGIQRGIFYVSAINAPATAAGWSGVKAIVLAGGLRNLTARQARAIRHWLIAGGTVWLIANHVSNRQAAWLLGDAWAVQSIGRTRVASFVIQATRHDHQAVHLRHSVVLLRLVTAGLRALLWIEGRPILWERPVGRGHLLVSALAVRGLVHGKDGGVGGAVLGRKLYGGPLVVRKTRHGLLDAARAAVGYRIMARPPVMAALGVFCLVLVAAAVGLNWRKRLAWFAPLGGAAALLTAGVVVLLGARHRELIPATASLAAVGRVSRSEHALAVRGRLLLYSPRTMPTTVAAGPVFRYWPKTGASAARMAWRPSRGGQWRDLPVSSGALLSGTVKGVQKLIKIPTALAQFTSRGLACRFTTGQFTAVHNLFIQGEQGAFALPRRLRGAAVLTRREMLPPGQTVRAVVFSQRQTADQRADMRLARPGRRAMFYFWTGRHATSAGQRDAPKSKKTPPAANLATLKVAPAGRRTQQMLIATPVTFQRTAPGGRVRIPSAFVGFKMSTVGGRFVRSTAYDHTTHTWLPNLNHGMTIWLKLQAPKAVLPLNLTEISVHAEISAPQRRVSVVVFRGGRVRMLGFEVSPTGRLTYAWKARVNSAPWPVSRTAPLYVGLRVAHINNPLRSWTLTRISVGLAGRVVAGRRAGQTPPTMIRSGHGQRR